MVIGGGGGGFGSGGGCISGIGQKIYIFCGSDIATVRLL